MLDRSQSFQLVWLIGIIKIMKTVMQHIGARYKNSLNYVVYYCMDLLNF